MRAPHLKQLLCVRAKAEFECKVQSKERHLHRYFPKQLEQFYSLTLKKSQVTTMASLKKQNQTKIEICCTIQVPKSISKIFIDGKMSVLSLLMEKKKSLTPHCPNFFAF